MTGFAADAGAVAHAFTPELDDDLTLEGGPAHHLGRVRRLRVDERVTVANGDGSWRLYEVARVERQRIVLHAVAVTVLEPTPSIRIVLAFAPTKGGQPERVVQQATELGVDELRILMTERTVVRWHGEREPAARARLERVATEAAGQCFRSRIPLLGPCVAPDDLDAAPGLIVTLRDGERWLSPPRASEWVAVVGPEGGFTRSELNGFGDAPHLGLGEYVLRAETAATSAAAILTSIRASGARRSPRGTTAG